MLRCLILIATLLVFQAVKLGAQGNQEKSDDTTLSESIITIPFNKPEEAGYMIMENGETVHGFFYVTKRKALYKSAYFRKLSEENPRIYGADSISSFYLNNSQELFIRNDIASNFNSQYDEAEFSKNHNYPFIKVIVEGPISLYKGYTNKVNYYLTKKDQQEILKREPKKLVTVSGANYEAGTAFYQNVLQRFFLDCFSDTVLVPVSIPGLTEKIKDYNTCRGEKSFASGKPVNHVLLGFTAGVLSSTLTFKDNNASVKPYGYPELAPYGVYNLQPLTSERARSNNFFAGLSLSVYPGWAKHFSLNFEMLYTRRAWNMTRIDLNLSYLDIPIAIRYHFNIAHRIQPFIDAGAVIAMNLKSDYTPKDYSWEFYRESFRYGKADTWPDTMNVVRPVYLDGEFQPSFVSPFISAGVQVMSNSAIVGVSLRAGFGGSLAGSYLFKSTATDLQMQVTVSPMLRERRSKVLSNSSQ